jgi:hypothetical protein
MTCLLSPVTRVILWGDIIVPTKWAFFLIIGSLFQLTEHTYEVMREIMSSTRTYHFVGIIFLIEIITHRIPVIFLLTPSIMLYFYELNYRHQGHHKTITITSKHSRRPSLTHDLVIPGRDVLTTTSSFSSDFLSSYPMSKEDLDTRNKTPVWARILRGHCWWTG